VNASKPPHLVIGIAAYGDDGGNLERESMAAGTRRMEERHK